MEILKTNIQALYDEVMPRYTLLKDKHVEIENLLVTLKEDMAAAKADYDIETMEALTLRISMNEQVLEQVRKDLDSYIAEMNEIPKHGGFNLKTKAYEALMSDKKLTDDTRDLANRKAQIEALEAQIVTLKQEIKQEAFQMEAELNKEMRKFNPLLLEQHMNVRM